MAVAVEANETGFAERLLEVIDTGRRTATYKLALLLALIDLCAKHTDADGHAPAVLFTRDIAQQVASLYWPQVAPFRLAGTDAVVLKQITLPRSTIVDAVAQFRHLAESEGATSLHIARLFLPVAYDAMLDRVEVAVAEQPLPRLQTVGTSDTPYPFLYDLEWGSRASLSVRRLRVMGDDQGAPVRLRPGAGDKLVQLAPLLRPLIELHWVRMVADLNGVTRVESSLHDHLFGRDRIPVPGPLRDGLADLQGGHCFYCDGLLRRTDADHFLPRVRCGIDAVENLILADNVCNNDKRDLLASPALVIRWTERNHLHGKALVDLALTNGWESDPDGTLGVARAIYGHLAPGDRPFWNAGGQIVLADPQQALVALQ